jgi:hypothetical protein
MTIEKEVLMLSPVLTGQIGRGENRKINKQSEWTDERTSSIDFTVGMDSDL